MVETTEVPEQEMVLPEPGHGDGVEHAHPGSAEYVRIALILGAITAVEVLIYYFDLDHRTLVGSLIILSAAKFALVAGFFMHLKFDSKIFTTFFAGALVMAIAAFIAVLAMFRAF
jgi:cytochrome c oxidase subunit 4